MPASHARRFGCIAATVLALMLPQAACSQVYGAELISPNAIAAYQIYPGSHYDIYSRHYRKASTRALEWFARHLRRQPDDASPDS